MYLEMVVGPLPLKFNITPVSHGRHLSNKGMLKKPKL